MLIGCPPASSRAGLASSCPLAIDTGSTSASPSTTAAIRMEHLRWICIPPPFKSEHSLYYSDNRKHTSNTTAAPGITTAADTQGGGAVTQSALRATSRGERTKEAPAVSSSQSDEGAARADQVRL